MPFEHISRSGPHPRDRLDVVVHAPLMRRRTRGEEARIEPAGRAYRGDPVAEGHEGVGCEVQVLFSTDLEEGALARDHRLPVQREPLGRVGIVEAEQRPIGGGRQQQAGLLEALPDGRKALRGVAYGSCGEPVGIVERTTGEHVRAGRDPLGMRPLEHEDLEPGAPVP